MTAGPCCVLLYYHNQETNLNQNIQELAKTWSEWMYVQEEMSLQEGMEFVAR